LEDTVYLIIGCRIFAVNNSMSTVNVKLLLIVVTQSSLATPLLLYVMLLNDDPQGVYVN